MEKYYSETIDPVDPVPEAVPEPAPELEPELEPAVAGEALLTDEALQELRDLGGVAAGIIAVWPILDDLDMLAPEDLSAVVAAINKFLESSFDTTSPEGVAVITRNTIELLASLAATTESDIDDVAIGIVGEILRGPILELFSILLYSLLLDSDSVQCTVTEIENRVDGNIQSQMITAGIPWKTVLAIIQIIWEIWRSSNKGDE